MIQYLDSTPDLQELLADVEIVYTDLDGTLLGHGGCLLVDGHGNPSTVAADAVVAANKAGITVVPVTGRSRFQLMDVARLCGWNDFIVESGCIISRWDGRERSVSYYTPSWDATVAADKTPLETIRAAGALEALQESFPGQVEYHSPWHERREASEVLRGRLDLDVASQLIATLDPALELIENGTINPKDHTLTQSDAPINAYHIVPKGCSKADSITEDLRWRGIHPTRALMIGDGYADLCCAPRVGVQVMVENALSSNSVCAHLDDYHNVAVVRGNSGEGWAAMMQAVLKAKGLL